jgi:hypothetical protein
MTPPTQPGVQEAEEPPVSPSFYRHRFAIYRRNTGTYAEGNQAVQLQLFKSFVKSIKKADQSAQILGACRNSPKRVYIFLYAFRRKPKSHLNARPCSIFFFRHKGTYFLCQSKKYRKGRCPPDIFYPRLSAAYRCINGSSAHNFRPVQPSGRTLQKKIGAVIFFL